MHRHPPRLPRLMRQLRIAGYRKEANAVRLIVGDSLHEVFDSIQKSHSASEEKPNGGVEVDPTLEVEGRYHELVEAVLLHFNQILRKDVVALVRKKYKGLDPVVVANGVMSSLAMHGSKALSGSPEIAPSKKWIPNLKNIQNHSVNRERAEQQGGAARGTHPESSKIKPKGEVNKEVIKAHKLLAHLLPDAKVSSSNHDLNDHRLWRVDLRNGDYSGILFLTVKMNQVVVQAKGGDVERQATRLFYRASDPSEMDLSDAILKAVHALHQDVLKYVKNQGATSEDPGIEDYTVTSEEAPEIHSEEIEDHDDAEELGSEDFATSERETPTEEKTTSERETQTEEKTTSEIAQDSHEENSDKTEELLKEAAYNAKNKYKRITSIKYSNRDSDGAEVHNILFETKGRGVGTLRVLLKDGVMVVKAYFTSTRTDKKTSKDLGESKFSESELAGYVKDGITWIASRLNRSDS